MYMFVFVIGKLYICVKTHRYVFQELPLFAVTVSVSVVYCAHFDTCIFFTYFPTCTCMHVFFSSCYLDSPT